MNAPFKLQPDDPNRRPPMTSEGNVFLDGLDDPDCRKVSDWSPIARFGLIGALAILASIIVYSFVSGVVLALRVAFA